MQDSLFVSEPEAVATGGALNYYKHGCLELRITEAHDGQVGSLAGRYRSRF